MKKRGNALVFISIITLVVGLFVGLIYPKIAKVYATGEIALKTSAARDIALIIDTLYAYPYDANIEYGYDLSNFIVDISQNSVKIYSISFVTLEGNEIKGNDPTFAKHSFTPVKKNANENLDYKFDQPKRLVFNKANGKLFIEMLR